ncbi:MAG: EMC3/TMCO1 family protein [Candidatus Woesearchaeota archaeon]
MSIISPLLSPLLKLDPFVAILILAVLISTIITLAYKFFTDQAKMKRLKKQLKKYQKEMKELKDQPDKMMKVQQKAMQTNMEYMKMSLKPTLITFLPIILVIWWMGANLAFYPIEPNEPFTVSAIAESGDITIDPQGLTLLSDATQPATNATWELQGPEGIYALGFSTDSESVTKSVKITTTKEYLEAEKEYDGQIKKVIINYEPIRPMQDIPLLGSIPWISGFGWLGTYILFSLIFGISMRRAMKLH